MECKYCGKKYKQERHLLKHEERCTDKPESKEEVEVNNESNEVKVSSPMESEIVKERFRRLTKLGNTILMCYDAEVKARLEREYRDLNGDIMLLRRSREIKFMEEGEG